MIGWTPRAALQPAQASAAAPDQPANVVAEASVPNGISVFDAVESELGLKLVKQKRTIPVIVVDHVDEKPLD